jgi:hypothetical protein
MNRFKFRAWDKSNKSFCPSPLWLLDPNGEVRWQYDNKSASDRLEVQQWTGLLTKGGREIYEGDIISHSYPEEGANKVIVKFGQVSESGEVGFIFYDHWDQGGPYEIIGNIFENPELLGK